MKNPPSNDCPKYSTFQASIKAQFNKDILTKQRALGNIYMPAIFFREIQPIKNPTPKKPTNHHRMCTVKYVLDTKFHPIQRL